MMHCELGGARLAAPTQDLFEVGRRDEMAERGRRGGARRHPPSRQTERRLRPLARLALITARPPRVFMRTRKPCVRARRTLEAW